MLTAFMKCGPRSTVLRHKKAAGRISAGRSQPGEQGGVSEFPSSPDDRSDLSSRLLRICGTSLVLLLSQWQMIAHPVDAFTLPTAPPTPSKARQLPPATWLNHWSQA